MLASVLALLTADPAPSPGCSYSRQGLLAETPTVFDQTMKRGWRALADRKCYLEAATAIRDYRDANRAKLQPYELHILYWHEGQTRALAGQREAAVPLLLAGVNPYEVGDFSDYAVGTVAFLQGDLPALQAARDRMAKTPEPDDWAATQARFKAATGTVTNWPGHLDELDGLVACFGKP